MSACKSSPRDILGGIAHHRQPSLCTITPPNRGPRVGPSSGPSRYHPKILARSFGSNMSLIVPPPLAIPTAPKKPDSVRIAINVSIFGLSALGICSSVKIEKQTLKQYKHLCNMQVARNDQPIHNPPPKRLAERCQKQRPNPQHYHKARRATYNRLLIGSERICNLLDTRCEHGRGERGEDAHQGDDEDVDHFLVDAPLPRVLAVAVVEGDEVAAVAAFARVGCLVVEEGLALVGGVGGVFVLGHGGCGGGGGGMVVRCRWVGSVEGGVGRGSPTGAGVCCPVRALPRCNLHDARLPREILDCAGIPRAPNLDRLDPWRCSGPGRNMFCPLSTTTTSAQSTESTSGAAEITYHCLPYV